MARLTIEEQWWTDPRREKLAKLVGDSLLADAVVLRLWRAAQEFWGKGRLPMPLEVFESLEHHRSIVEAKLATIEGDLVYVRGTNEHQTWLAEKRAAAAAGGKKSAESRRKKTGSAQPKSEAKPKHSRSTAEANPKVLEPSGSYSGSGSDSLKIPKTSSSGASASLPAVVEGNLPDRRGKNAVALWMEAYHRRYGRRYPALGKDHGTLMGLEKNYPGDQLEIFFAAYLAMKDPLYVSQNHPLSLFFRDLPRIAGAAHTGVDPSVGEEPEWKKEARRKEAERKGTNAT